MITPGYNKQISDLELLIRAILSYAPRRPSGELGRPYTSWIKDLENQVHQAKRWTGTDNPPPESPQNTGDAHDVVGFGLGGPTDPPPPEKPSESHPSASLHSNDAQTEDCQLQHPRPAKYLLPLLCRVLLLKEFPANSQASA